MYWILETDCPGESEGSISARGPFETMGAAKAWLRKDTVESFLSCDGSLRENDGIPWAAPKIIVKQEEKIEVIPHARVTVKLNSL